MTELEWLKQESGLDETELKAMEAVAGHTKFVGMLQKLLATNEQSTKAKTEAEQARLDLEKRYQEEFIPEMRKVTQDSLRAQGEAARATAALKAARDYGIVPEEEVKPNTSPAEVRAPGSPDPAQFEQWSRAQSRAIITLNDLNAEHFKLFGSPLPDSESLVNEVERQKTLGHKDFTLKRAWEQKFNVESKRTEIQQAETQKIIDAKVQEGIKDYRQKNGSHPGLVSGQTSRFDKYTPADANQGKEPWKTPSGGRRAANQPWRDKATEKVAAA